MSRSAKAASLTFGLVLTAAIGWAATRWMDGPWGPFPGGRFHGVGTSCGSVDWERFSDAREMELEVWPRRPRSITTWSVVHESGLFIPADFLTPWKRWPEQVLEDERIRIRLKDRIFDCRAEHVTDAELIDALRQAVATKYEIAPDGRAATVEVWWFRVRPR